MPRVHLPALHEAAPFLFKPHLSQTVDPPDASIVARCAPFSSPPFFSICPSLPYHRPPSPLTSTMAFVSAAVPLALRPSAGSALTTRRPTAARPAALRMSTPPMNPDGEKEEKTTYELVTGAKIGLCRCYKSATFPICNGAHAGYNKKVRSRGMQTTTTWVSVGRKWTSRFLRWFSGCRSWTRGRRYMTPARVHGMEPNEPVPGSG